MKSPIQPTKKIEQQQEKPTKNQQTIQKKQANITNPFLPNNPNNNNSNNPPLDESNNNDAKKTIIQKKQVTSGNPFLPNNNNSNNNNNKGKNNPFVAQRINDPQTSEMERPGIQEPDMSFVENFDAKFETNKILENQQTDQQNIQNEKDPIKQLVIYLKTTSPDALDEAMNNVVANEHASDKIGFVAGVKNTAFDAIGYGNGNSIKEDIAQEAGYDLQKSFVENIKIGYAKIKDDFSVAFDKIKNLKKAKLVLEVITEKTDIGKLSEKKLAKLNEGTQAVEEIINYGESSGQSISQGLSYFKSIAKKIPGAAILLSDIEDIVIGGLGMINESVMVAKSTIAVAEMKANKLRIKKSADKGEMELNDQLIKTNEKRIKRGNSLVETNVMKISGAIIGLAGGISTIATGGSAFPITGAIMAVGNIIKGSAKAIEAGRAVFRGVKQFFRDSVEKVAEAEKNGTKAGLTDRIAAGIGRTFGADSNKSSRKKREKYAKIGKSIFSLMRNFQKEPETSKMTSIKSYIFATGINYDNFIQETVSKPNQAALMLYTAAKKRQSSDEIQTDSAKMYGQNKMNSINEIRSQEEKEKADQKIPLKRT